jgi:hypothetical protein
LLLKGEILTDVAALELAETKQNDPHTYFKEILEKIDIEQLSPSISYAGQAVLMASFPVAE